MDIVKRTKRTVVLIVASSNDGVIGLDNSIPWNCKSDSRFFKMVTLGNIVIMGRKTYESLNSRPLDNRSMIVISETLKQSDVHPEVMLVNNLDTALARAKNMVLYDNMRTTQSEHIFIIGGVSIYNDIIGRVDEVLHSTIDVTVSSDASIGDVFIKTKLMPKFIDNEAYDTITLYSNTTPLRVRGDKHRLSLITHSFKKGSTPLTFKDISYG